MTKAFTPSSRAISRADLVVSLYRLVEVCEMTLRDEIFANSFVNASVKASVMASTRNF